MFIYSQTTGNLWHDGALMGNGYSGHGDGVNNPSMENIRMVGPIPVGKYTIQPPSVHPQLGPIAMALEPDPANTMFGRAGFFMHGGHAADQHDSSEGCIIMGRDIRLAVSAAVNLGDTELQVTQQ